MKNTKTFLFTAVAFEIEPPRKKRQSEATKINKGKQKREKNTRLLFIGVTCFDHHYLDYYFSSLNYSRGRNRFAIHIQPLTISSKYTLILDIYFSSTGRYRYIFRSSITAKRVRFIFITSGASFLFSSVFFWQIFFNQIPIIFIKIMFMILISVPVPNLLFSVRTLIERERALIVMVDLSNT